MATHDNANGRSSRGGDAERGLREVPPKEGAGRPRDLPAASWTGALKRTVRGFQADNLTDWAAALTYYAVLSIFPGLLVLVAVLGLLGPNTVQSVQDNLAQIAPGGIRNVLTGVVAEVKNGQGSAGTVAIVGLLAAFWSASGYVGAFMRASNSLYDVPEGRPIWKTLPIRIGVTAAVGVLLVISVVIVVFTGRLAQQVGGALGVGSAALTAWSILKWPVLIVLVSLMFAILYWASPNARRGFRWVSPGGLLAVLLWIVASVAFALYVANFGSYNKTYGALAGAVIFLVWLWISNLAILLGAEFDAEFERGRAIAAGRSPDEEPFVQLRDTRKLKRDDKPGEERAGS
jgi:membrane protein